MTQDIQAQETSVRPHATRVQVWEVPSPVVMDAPFNVKVGVECSEGCDLTGQAITVYDDAGEAVATGTLAAVPWSTTPNQYGVELQVQAPGIENRIGWEVQFEPDPEMPVPHEPSVGTLAVGVSRPPELVVTVEVVDKETQAPIPKAHVTLRPSTYRGFGFFQDTDDTGTARLHVPQDEYNIAVAHREFKSHVKVCDIAGDTTLRTELVVGNDMDDIWG